MKMMKVSVATITGLFILAATSVIFTSGADTFDQYNNGIIGPGHA